MKAMIYNIKPFDKNVGTTIKFSWAGSTITGNTLKIVDQETKQQVYSNKVTSKKLENIIKSSNSLVNGKKYIAYITVHYKEGTAEKTSAQSAGKQFLCLSNPTFEFEGVSSDNKLSIASSSYQFTLNYAQAEGEKLDSWKISVYDVNMMELSTTNLQYNTSDMYHRFYGFASGVKYYVVGYGQTVNGLNIQTERIEVNPVYDMKEVFSKLDLTNIREKATVLLHSNIIRADGTSQKKVTYIDGEWADLTSNYIIYDGGFVLDGNFSQVMYVKGLERNTPFFDFYSERNPDFHGQITYRVGNIDENSASDIYGQFELKVTDKNAKGITSTYVIYSERIERIYGTTIVGIHLMRKNGLYSLHVLVDSNVTTTSEEG